MFRVKRRMIVTVSAVTAVLFAGALTATLLTQGKGNATNSVEYAAGQRPLLPDFTGTSLTGDPVKLSGYRGQTVVLNFWGSWCSPCREEAPTLALLAKQDSAKGVAFLGDDVSDTPANALAFTGKENIPYRSINDQGSAVAGQISQVVPVKDTPTTVVIDKTGHVAAFIVGTVSYGQLSTFITDAAVTK